MHCIYFRIMINPLNKVMKTNREEFLKTGRRIILIFALIFSTTMSSQIAKLGPPPPGLPLDSVPLDGGLLYLVIGAAFYGVKKVREPKN